MAELDARDWHSFAISRGGNKSDATYKSDMEAVERRRKREALAEAKSLRDLDELDSEWQEMWK